MIKPLSRAKSTHFLPTKSPFTKTDGVCLGNCISNERLIFTLYYVGNHEVRKSSSTSTRSIILDASKATLVGNDPHHRIVDKSLAGNAQALNQEKRVSLPKNLKEVPRHGFLLS